MPARLLPLQLLSTSLLHRPPESLTITSLGSRDFAGELEGQQEGPEHAVREELGRAGTVLGTNAIYMERNKSQRKVIWGRVQSISGPLAKPVLHHKGKACVERCVIIRR